MGKETSPGSQGSFVAHTAGEYSSGTSQPPSQPEQSYRKDQDSPFPAVSLLLLYLSSLPCKGWEGCFLNFLLGKIIVDLEKQKTLLGKGERIEWSTLLPKSLEK